MTGENRQEHNTDWLHIANHPYGILIDVDSRSGKMNALLSLIKDQPGIDKSLFSVKDPYKPKHQLLINKDKYVGLKLFKASKTFIWIL